MNHDKINNLRAQMSDLSNNLGYLTEADLTATSATLHVMGAFDGVKTIRFQGRGEDEAWSKMGSIKDGVALANFFYSNVAGITVESMIFTLLTKIYGNVPEMQPAIEMLRKTINVSKAVPD